MNVQTTIATLCFSTFKNRLESHFRARKASFGFTHTIYIGKATRKYQHFQICFVLHVEPPYVFGPTMEALLFDCYYNTQGDLEMSVKLNDEDPFQGAADCDSTYGRARYFAEDIIRSFADVRPTFTRAIFKI